MCGIGGIVRVWKAGERPPGIAESIPEEWLNILDSSVKHRGPDGQGRFRERVVRGDGATVDVALVHRRLSIIDHAGGGQPMVLGASGERRMASGEEEREGSGQLLWMAGPSAGPPGGLADYREARAHVCPKCGPCAVVFNGCIYNHRELRRELQGLGHVFQSDHSDTEVLLHGWGEWKGELFKRLEGMYGLGIWDGTTGSFIGSRDLAGEKPLYGKVRHDLNAYVFASSPVGLTVLGRAWGPPQIVKDEEGELEAENYSTHMEHHLEFWLGGGDWELPMPEAEEYPPGLSAEWPQTPRLKQIGLMPPMHWPNFRAGNPQPITADEVDEAIKESVESRLDADVALGCFLSGGVDSSLVAWHAHRAHGAVHTFTVRMPSAQLDESSIAAQVAGIIGSDHHTLECEATPASDVVRLIHQLGLPFGDSSLLPTHWVSKAVRQSATVALGGDGADELFGGYERHVVSHRRWIEWILWAVPGAVFPSRNPKALTSKLRRLSRSARYGGWLGATFDDVDRVRLLSGPRPKPRHPRFRRSITPDVLRDDALTTDFKHYLPEDILRKTDTASMAVALEVRSPFLSRDLIKACLSAPLSNLMPGGQRKGLLRQVARKYFPPEIVDRPKQGFAIPIGEWFRSDYGGMRQLLRDHLEGPDPFPGLPVEINMKFVHRMLREHDAAGEKSINPWHGRDHSQRLYMLLVLSIWAKWLSKL